MYKFDVNNDENSVQGQLQSRLAGMLSPEMQERYKAKRQEAIAAQQANYQGPEAIEALGSGQDLRAFQTGMQRAANKFGSVGGDGGAESNFGATAKAFDDSAKQTFALKQDAYNQATKAETDAVDGEYQNTVARPMGVAEGISTLNNQDREASLNSKLDPLKVSGAQTQNSRNELDFKNESARVDPNSAESVALRTYAIDKYGTKTNIPANATAAQLEKLIPLFQREKDLQQAADDRRNTARESREARAETAREAQANRDLVREQMANAKTTAAADKHEQKQEELKIEGIGYAKTAQDAKDLKEAVISKKSFDNKLSQLIALREKHSGGAILNRDDVGDAKSLSKQLLLDYKNIAKLGVLSQSDEHILNAIIPSDPLEYNSPLAGIQGQDPILTKMKSFQKNTQVDYDTRLNLKLQGGFKPQEAKAPGEDKPANKPSVGHGNDLP